jgi:hypothetical protein
MITERIYCKRLLIITGSGKNAGKTTLVNSIIQSMQAKYPVVAIKISPHFHKVEYNPVLYESAGNYMIYEENSDFPEKDSSKMKHAGANRVFYIQSDDQYTGEAFLKCLEYIEGNLPVICESGSLDQFIAPGLLIYIRKDEVDVKRDTIHSTGVVISRDRDQFSSVLDKIFFYSGKWVYKEIRE